MTTPTSLHSNYYTPDRECDPPPPKKLKPAKLSLAEQLQEHPARIYRTYRCHNHKEFLERMGLTKEVFLRLRQSWPPPYNVNASPIRSLERIEKK